MKPNTPVAQEIYFSFQLKSSRPNLNGECPIVFRIIYRRQRKDVFTGLSCPPKHWLKEERSVSLRYSTASTINHQLHRILANAEHHFNKLKFLGEAFTLDDLVNEMVSAEKGKKLEAGIQIAGRMIKQLRDEKICDGVHIMAIGKEGCVPDILKAAE